MNTLQIDHCAITIINRMKKINHRKKDVDMRVSYENWEGKTRERLISPDYIHFGATKWHVTPQWLLRCTDLVSNELHDFALSKMMTLDIHQLHLRKD